MLSMTATEFARNIKRTLDRIEFGGEEIIIIRNKHPIARILPGSPHLTALDAMADLYQTLQPEAAADWLADSRIPGTLADELRDPWDT